MSEKFPLRYSSTKHCLGCFQMSKCPCKSKNKSEKMFRVKCKLQKWVWRFFFCIWQYFTCRLRLFIWKRLEKKCAWLLYQPSRLLNSYLLFYGTEREKKSKWKKTKHNCLLKCHLGQTIQSVNVQSVTVIKTNATIYLPQLLFHLSGCKQLLAKS